ncbi:MAG: hypothetical protein ACRDYZ_12910 [Acidimicrobiales bacterium]
MSSDGQLQKADFGEIYDQPDPRAYFAKLQPFDYVIPQHGADLFTRLLGARGTAATQRARILDVCCSYGVVSTLMKTDLDVADIYDHYGEAAEQDLTTVELTEADQRLLKEYAVPDPAIMVGLDVAANAVEYAVGTGALDAGFAENLEVDPASPELTSLVSEVDLITTTGGVGYVTERTFDQLLDAANDNVWVASFCLRTYDYGPIIDSLDDHGLQTERLPQTFPQRRFTGPDEREWAMAQVRELGADPEGKETEGYYHADFYLSRPTDEAHSEPMAELFRQLHESAS